MYAARTAHQNGLCILERVGHGNEIELASDAADNTSVLECIGHCSAKQSHHHSFIHESGLSPLPALASFIAD